MRIFDNGRDFFEHSDVCDPNHLFKDEMKMTQFNEIAKNPWRRVSSSFELAAQKYVMGCRTMNLQPSPKLIVNAVSIPNTLVLKRVSLDEQQAALLGNYLIDIRDGKSQTETKALVISQCSFDESIIKIFLKSIEETLEELVICHMPAITTRIAAVIEPFMHNLS